MNRRLLKVCSINFEPSDNDLCSACHVYPLSRGAWIISILFIFNRFTWGLNYVIWWISQTLWPSESKHFSDHCQWSSQLNVNSSGPKRFDSKRKIFLDIKMSHHRDQKNSWGSGGRCKPPSGSRAEPWWGPRGRSPRKLREFGHFKALKLALLQQFRQDFYYKNLKAERHILKDWSVIKMCFSTFSTCALELPIVLSK